jgi:hypothetical protein
LTIGLASLGISVLRYRRNCKMKTNQREYVFETVVGENLRIDSTDAVSAFHSIKRADQDNYFKLKRYKNGLRPLVGFSLLSIGYGLSVAYKIND